MGESARITSIDALREMKASIAEFCDRVTAAFAAVDSDLTRTTLWLNQDQPAYYKQAIRRTEDQLGQARSQLLRKQLTRDPDPVSVVEEKQRIDRLKRRLDELRQRQENVRRWAPQWERKAMMFMSARRGLAEAVHFELPRAMERLELASRALEEYVRLQPPSAELAPTTTAESVAPPQRGVSTEPTPLSAADRYALLREFAIAPENADGLSTTTVPLAWEAGALPDSTQRAIADLASAAAAPNADDLVCVAWRALRSPGVFLVRGTPRRRPDGLVNSGWFVGPMESPDTAAGCVCLTVARLLELAPTFAPLLSLRPGGVVVIVNGEVKAVLDEQNHDLWHAEPS